MAPQQAPKLNSSHSHIKSIATYGTIASERTPEANWIHTLGEWENIHIKTGRRDWETIPPETHPLHSDIESGGNSQIPASPWRVKDLDQHLMLWLLRLPPKRWVPKTSSSESQWDARDYNKDTVLRGLVRIHSGYPSRPQNRGSTLKHWAFSWKRPICIS